MWKECVWESVCVSGSRIGCTQLVKYNTEYSHFSTKQQLVTSRLQSTNKKGVFLVRLSLVDCLFEMQVSPHCMCWHVCVCVCACMTKWNKTKRTMVERVTTRERARISASRKKILWQMLCWRLFVWLWVVGWVGVWLLVSRDNQTKQYTVPVLHTGMKDYLVGQYLVRWYQGPGTWYRHYMDMPYRTAPWLIRMLFPVVHYFLFM